MQTTLLYLDPTKGGFEKVQKRAFKRSRGVKER